MDNTCIERTNLTSSNVHFANNWKVVLYNDDTTSELFILEKVLCGVFQYNSIQGYALMKLIEATNSQVIAILPKKLAEVRIKKCRHLAENEGYKDFRIEIEEDKK